MSNVEFEFINPNKHSVVVIGQNRERIEFKPGQKRRLGAWFRKYSPKYIIVAGNPISLKKIIVPTPHVQKSSVMERHIVKPPVKVVSKSHTNLVVHNNKAFAGSRNRLRRLDDERRIVGRQSHRGKVANEFFKKAIHLLTIPISNNIGVGILSYNRLDCISRLIKSIRVNTDLTRTTVFVSDESTDSRVKEWLKNQKDIVVLDNAERLGVAGNTNRLMRCLDRFKYKIILNDDVEILKAGWDKLYPAAMIETGCHHFCMRQDGVYHASRSEGKIVDLEACAIHTVDDRPHGAVMAFDDKAFEIVGYFDESFGLYGFEHVDWSNRVSLSKIQAPGFHDVVGSEQFFKIFNEKTSIECPERHKAFMIAKAKFSSVQHDTSRIYVNASDRTKVQEVSYIVPFSGQTRLDSLATVVNNIRAQKFPRIETVLAEQGRDRTVNLDRIGPVRYVLDKNDTNQFIKAIVFNKGVIASKCEKMVLHDADMLVGDRYTSEVFEELEKAESCHIGSHVVYMDGVSTGSINRNCKITGAMNSGRIVNYYEGGSLACSRSVYFRIGGFNESFVGYGIEDCEFFERLKKCTKFTENRHVVLIHLDHSRSVGWKQCHERNKELYRRLSTKSITDRVRYLVDALKLSYPEAFK